MNKIKQTIYEALDKSGAIIRRRINRSKKIYYKGRIDLLTTTDTKVERTVIRIIKKACPHDSILAEESSPHKQTGSRVWIIDPVDGTTNFAHGFPAVVTSIALESKGTVIAGGVYDPMRDELFYAEKGKGAFCNNKKIKVSTTTSLAQSLLATGFPYDRKKHADYYLSLFKAFMIRTHGIRRMGAAALDLCYVACGRLDGFWELKLKPWDVAAGALLITEAGGNITDFANKKHSLYGTEILATNGRIHTAMKKVLQTATNTT